jgi:hypothetical protein
VTPERFTISIPQSSLDDLRARLERYRAAPDFGNDDWRYGMEGRFLRSLVDSWLDDYDWRAAEAEMNRYEHWRVSIDGVPIHYMRKRAVGGGAKPMPLVLTHGWPWTFWDHRYVVDAPSPIPAHTAGIPPTPSTSSCPRFRASRSRARSRRPASAGPEPRISGRS